MEHNKSLLALNAGLEAGASVQGADRYRAKLGPRLNPWTQRTTAPGRDSYATSKILINRALSPVSAEVAEWMSGIFNGSAGQGVKFAPFLLPFVLLTDDGYSISADKLAQAHINKAADKLAYITLSQVMRHIGGQRNACILAIANALKYEMETAVLASLTSKTVTYHDTGEYKRLAGLVAGLLNSKAYKALKKLKEEHNIEAMLGITTQVKISIATKLYDIVFQGTGWIQHTETETTSMVGGKRRVKASVKVDPTAELLAVIADGDNLLISLSPVYPILVAEPRDWVNYYDGGYYSQELALGAPLIKASRPYIDYLGDAGQGALRAVNLMQQTPFRLNQRVLATLHDVLAAKIRMEGIPAFTPIDIPSRPCPIEDKGLEENKEAWAKYVIEVNEAISFNRHPSRAADILELQRVLDIANTYSTYDRIYYTQQMDFRSRCYPVQCYLNVQSADRSAGLLEFANGKALGKAGLYWLKIHGANTMGKDANTKVLVSKLVFSEREAWVDSHITDIMGVHADPMAQDSLAFWIKAKTPFKFLAFCIEYGNAISSGNPEAYVSHLPVAMDGVANGIQHLAALARCETAASRVCLNTGDKITDLYIDIAKKATELLKAKWLSAQEDASTRKIAGFILPHTDRAMVKNAVMTKSYGVTVFGLRQQFRDKLNGIKGFKTLTREEQALGVGLITNTTDEALNSELPNVMHAMKFLSATASILAKAGVGCTWTTLDGVKVVQAYKEQDTRIVTTTTHAGTKVSNKNVAKLKSESDKGTALEAIKAGKYKKGMAIRVYYKEDTLNLDVKKQVNGIVPNLVHSMDATAMRMAICKAADYGVTDYVMVHDSYATHACDYDKLAKATREAFVELHTNYTLDTWLNEVLSPLDEESQLLVRMELAAQGNAIRYGKLHLPDVLASRYFFS